jgi:fumarate hydratase class II
MLALKNFRVGEELMPKRVIYALVKIKKAAALANCELKILSKDKCKLICLAADEVLDGKLDNQFPLFIWQSGSGTQTNMNVNEVLAIRAMEMSKGKVVIHPNDDVNMAQSSNDTFIAAMHMAALEAIKGELLKALLLLQKGFHDKAKEFKDVIKVARTHMMDAVPMSLGQEMSAFEAQLRYCVDEIKQVILRLQELPLGGTAVGTGINAHKKFAPLVICYLNRMMKEKFREAENKFALISSSNGMVAVSGVLRELALILMKVGRDITYLASGPRSGIGEIKFKGNEAGSSIMPGKVNPTQCELLRMVGAQVVGNDVTITMAAMQADLQLHACRPVMIFNVLNSIKLLTDGMNSFYKNCLLSIEPNLERIRHNLDNSLMVVTKLTGKIGYDKAAEVVKRAVEDNLSIKEAILKLDLLSEEELTNLLDYTKMV